LTVVLLEIIVFEFVAFCTTAVASQSELTQVLVFVIVMLIGKFKTGSPTVAES
jgi:hypothetical protein